MKRVKRLSKNFHHMSLNYKLHVKFRNEPVFKTKARDNYSSHLLLEHYIAFCGGLCIVLMKHLKIWSQSSDYKHNESLTKRDHMLRWWCKSVGGVQIVPGNSHEKMLGVLLSPTMMNISNFEQSMFSIKQIISPLTIFRMQTKTWH